LYDLGVLNNLECAGRGGHGWVGRRGRRAKAQLLYLNSGCGGSQLNAALLAIQHSLSLGFHGDNASRSRYLELDVDVARDGHELDITWPPQNDVIGPGEVDHFEGERLSVVVACVPEGDGQINLPEADALLAGTTP
jgi:hypothetical protein